MVAKYFLGGRRDSSSRTDAWEDYPLISAKVNFAFIDYSLWLMDNSILLVHRQRKSPTESLVSRWAFMLCFKPLESNEAI